MKIAWTGTRPIPGIGFTIDEYIAIALDVIKTVSDGDEVGQGGCRGVDEVVLRTASLLRVKLTNLRIVTWPADGELSWAKTRAPLDVLLRSDECRWREKGWGYLERDRALVDWADQVRAIPLEPFRYNMDDTIMVKAHSGTNYTARYAEEKGKLVASRSLFELVREAENHPKHPGDNH